MIKHLLTASIILALSLAANAGDWTLVADRVQSVPLEKVVCLISSDASSRMTVVCEDGNSIYDVARVTFSSDSYNAGVSTTTLADQTLAFSADSQLIVTGLRKPGHLRVYAADGKCCLDAELQAADESRRIDISRLPAGVYMAEIKGVSIKFVKK